MRGTSFFEFRKNCAPLFRRKKTKALDCRVEPGAIAGEEAQKGIERRIVTAGRRLRGRWLGICMCWCLGWWCLGRWLDFRLVFFLEKDHAGLGHEFEMLNALLSEARSFCR